MLYHSGGVNKTSQQRRAINNVYTIPMMKQQVNLPNILDGLYKDDPILKKLLGYTTTVPNSIQDYYDTR
jgi:ectoine hydroxylase-related dioxygenase (phytanoyl-CoA dioxygenase family)